MPTNVLSDVMPKILARGLVRLRKRLVMPQLVNRDFSTDAQTRGDTVNVKIPPTVVTRAVASGLAPVDAPALTINTIPIVLDQWHEAPIALSDKDVLEIEDESVGMAIDAAADAMAEKINLTLLLLHTQIYNAVGAPGTTPFGSNYEVATAARRILQHAKAPGADRFMIVNPEAEEEAINLATFADASFTGGTGVILDGDIGRKLGFDWFMDQDVPIHTPGTLTDGTDMAALIDNAAVAVGDVSVPMDETSLVGTVVPGDVFTVAGDPQQYVCNLLATAASDAIVVTFDPPAKVAWADDAAVTFFGGATGGTAYSTNLAMHRSAFALAMRTFKKPASNAQVLTMVDDVTGIPLRLEMVRQNKQDYWTFDALWGIKAVRPELCVKIAGEST